MKSIFTTTIRLSLAALILVSFSLSVSAQQWEMLGDTPFLGKHHSNGFGYNGKAYVLEGIDYDDYYTGATEVWEYTPDTDTWTQIADSPAPGRAFAIGDEWDNKFYYGFGIGKKDVWVFDPADLSHTKLPDCPCEPRYHPAFVAHNDKLFVGSGSGNNGDLNDWWEYDMITQEWSQKPNIPGGNRHHPFHFSHDKYIYVGGGHRTNWIRYNPETEMWIEINDAPKGRVAGTQFGHNGKGYVLGGDTANHGEIPQPQSFMRYDPEYDSWEYLPGLPNRTRWAPSSFIIDDFVYFFGGLGYGTFANDNSVWKLDLLALDQPSPTKDISDLKTIFAFPNPFQSVLSFSAIDGKNKKYDLTIFDLRGALLYTKSNFDLGEDLDLSFLSNGLYILDLKNDGEVIRLKVVKEE